MGQYRSYLIALSTKKILLLLYLFYLFSIKVEMKKKKEKIEKKRITLTKEMPYGVSKAYLESERLFSDFAQSSKLG